MMADHGFGATFDVPVELPTTKQDDFKRQMVHSIRLRYPSLTIDVEAEIPFGKSYLRPDVIVRVPGTTVVVTVADAKCRATISGADVMKLAKYRIATGAKTAALYHPKMARISASVRQKANQNGVELVPSPV